MNWQPLERAIPHRNGKPIDMPDNMSQWMNDDYVVIRRVIESDKGADPMIHLSIRRTDRGAARDWRDFQRIKNQLAGAEYEGCELYPAETRKVDTANQYHLWCFPFSLGFGLGTVRMVTNSDVTEAVEIGAQQRDNEPIDGPVNSTEELERWESGHDEAREAGENE